MNKYNKIFVLLAFTAYFTGVNIYIYRERVRDRDREILMLRKTKLPT